MNFLRKKKQNSLPCQIFKNLILIKMAHTSKAIIPRTLYAEHTTFFTNQEN